MEEFKANQLKNAYALSVSAIAPRPIALVSTLNENGSTNIGSFSFFTVASVNPFVLAIVPLISKDPKKPTKDTLKNIGTNRQAVIHIVTEEIADIANKVSVDLPYGISEADYVDGITLLNSTSVAVKRIAESPVHFECELAEPLEGQDPIISFGTGPLAGNIIFLEVIHVHIDPIFLNEDGSVKTTEMNLVGRADGLNWTRSAYFSKPSERKVDEEKLAAMSNT